METKVFLTRHCQPDLSNHDDRSRNLGPKGLQDCQLVRQFLREREISQPGLMILTALLENNGWIFTLSCRKGNH